MADDSSNESLNGGEAAPAKVKRTRKGGSRSKTGCITCRLRRVKCDEIKPECMRCLNARRKCEGYPSIFANTKPWEVVQVPSIGPMIKPSLNPRVASNDYAIHSFQFFEVETTRKLAEVYGKELWTEAIPRAALHCPAIWHAAIALGSAHEAHWQNNIGPGCHQSKIEWTFAQYNRAIRTLMQPDEQGNRHNLDVMIAASILFMAFEMLRREHGKAVSHVKSGMNMFKEYRRQLLADGSIEDGALIPMRCLERSLRHVEIQMCELTLDHYPAYPLPVFSFFDRDALPLGMSPRPSTKSSFVHLDDARLELGYYWHSLMDKLHYSYPPESQSSIQFPESFGGQRELYYFAILEWFDKFTELVTNLKSRMILPSRDRGDIARLETYALLLLQLLETYWCTDESVWDQSLERFERILELCRITASNDQFGDPQCDMKKAEAYCGFQLGSGIVAAAFHVIWKCRTARIRLRAIQLLQSYPRREALWDAPIVIKVGEQLDDIERGHGMLYDAALRDAQADEIAIWKRVRFIGVKFGPENRVAEINYKVPKSQTDDTIIEVKRTIAWPTSA